MFFDYISDIHLDFWVKLDHNQRKMQHNIRDFVSKLLPDKPQDVLVIAGDIGHYLHQNRLLLLYLREVYKTIFYVFGNHDYYLLSNQMKKNYRNSYGKAAQMEAMLRETDGIIRLNGEVYERGGIRFGGSDGWYDFSYGVQALGQSPEEVYQHWWNVSNDRVFHIGLPETMAHAKAEKEKLKNLVCDVLLTHVPPIGIPINDSYATQEDLSFYTFDARDLFQEKKPSVWVSGHLHQHIQHKWNDIQLVVNALGYPDHPQATPHPITTYRPEGV